jgi:hypothetical protein
MPDTYICPICKYVMSESRCERCEVECTAVYVADDELVVEDCDD